VVSLHHRLIRNRLHNRCRRSEPKSGEPKAVSEARARIRKASASDLPLILDFIRKLAEYERMSHEMVSTEEDLRDAMFGERPLVEALLAFSPASSAGSSPGSSDGEPVGFALYFEIYSTFRGRRGIFLEDLFVEPRHRGQGFGSALLAATARVAEERGGWLQWLVLDWNEPALAFYRSLGATRVELWDSYRLQGDPLKRLAMR
jgi:GNAT superfamily N-acetyltransferase